MKRTLWIVLTTLMLATVGVESVSAQKFELGARVGVGLQNMDVEFAGIADAKARLGWNAAVVSRIRIIGFGDGLLGAGLFFQPEVVYSQSNLKVTEPDALVDPGGYVPGGTSKIRMATVDVPLMLSLKVSVARIQAGPVFNLMNNFKTVDGSLELLPLRPAVGYAVGASVDLLGLTFDARYHGDFKKMSFSGDWADIKSRFSSWSVGVGIMF